MGTPLILLQGGFYQGGPASDLELLMASGIS